jgi:hypothetical protein
MASDITVEQGASANTSAPVRSAAIAGTSIDLPRLISLACGLKRVAHLLRGVEDAPVLPVGALVEAQALLGLPLRAPFDDQDFLWRRHNQGLMYESDPFAAEFPFQHDRWSSNDHHRFPTG